MIKGERICEDIRMVYALNGSQCDHKVQTNFHFTSLRTLLLSPEHSTLHLFEAE